MHTQAPWKVKNCQIWRSFSWSRFHLESRTRWLSINVLTVLVGNGHRQWAARHVNQTGDKLHFKAKDRCSNCTILLQEITNQCPTWVAICLIVWVALQMLPDIFGASCKSNLRLSSSCASTSGILMFKMLSFGPTVLQNPSVLGMSINCCCNSIF